jgi:polygalacturonase
MAMLFSFCEDVTLRDLTFQNSPGVHIKLFASINVEVGNLQISSPEDSPNTDGINIASSQHVVIRSSTIGTGDDCVSIITGSSNIQINDIVCGPGHGISIGSLGKDNARDTVANVVVRGAYLTGTTNGLRIKTWQGGSGYAQNISFQNVKMNNVSNPIIIDQYYCGSSSGCRNQTSAVQVSSVSYTGISGTSATPEAIRLACSSTVPCTNIVMEDVNIRMIEGFPSTSFVDNVKGFLRHGPVNPHF